MRLFLLVLTVICFLFAFAETVFPGVDAHTWNTARRKFYKDFDDAEKLPGLIDEMAGLNDKRAVEMLCKKTLFHDSFDIRVQTFDALTTTTDPEAVEYLAEQVRRDKNNKLIYTRLLKYFSGKEVNKAIKEALDDKRWEVVSAGLESARRQGTPELLELLQKELKNKNPRLAYEAAVAYKACGGDLPDSFTITESGGILPDKVFSKKCVVLFDISDDMATKMALPGHAMKELVTGLKNAKPKEFDKTFAKLEDKSDASLYEKYCVVTRQFYGANMVARTLSSLEKGAEGNVIIYSIGSAFWRKKFGKFSSKDISALRNDLSGYMTRPARDLYDALKRAMDIEDIDTIMIVTCGFPAGARVEDTDYILSWLKEKNYLRSVRIHTSVVLSNYAEGNPSDQLKLSYEKGKEPILSFYKKLAEQNGGKFRQVTDLGRVPVSASDSEPTEEAAKEPAKEPAKEHAKEPAKEHAKEPAKEPSKESEKKEPEKVIEKKPEIKPEEKEPEKKEPEKKEPEKKEPEKKPKLPKKDDGWLPGGK